MNAVRSTYQVEQEPLRLGRRGVSRPGDIYNHCVGLPYPAETLRPDTSYYQYLRRRYSQVRQSRVAFSPVELGNN